MELTAPDILKFAIDRASAINTYWNIYVAVVTAILGTLASGKPFTNSRVLKGILTAAFVVFAYSNWDAIVRLGELRTALLELLPSSQANREALVKSLSPATYMEYSVFHWTLNLIVVVSIWLVPWVASKRQDSS